MTVKIDGTNTVANPAFTGADTDTGLQCGTNELKLVTGGTARATVDSSGNLGVGTTSPALSIGSVSGKVLHAAGAGTTGARFENTSGTSIEFFAGSDAVINTGTSTNMAFKINDSEKMRILSSGGLTFNGDTSTANALDDYEEGTFTPSLTFDGNQVGMSISNAEGHYTKIGRLVSCFVRLALTSKGSSTGFAAITNLPFTVSDTMTTTAVQGGAHLSFISAFTTTAVALYAQPWENTSTARLYHSVSFASVEVTNDSDLGNSFDFRLTFSYMT